MKPTVSPAVTVAKVVLIVLGLLPLAWSLWQISLLQAGEPHSLGADPGETLLHLQGQWAIRFLLITLLVSPVQALTHWKSVVRFRRILGLLTFFYATLHLSAYAVFLLELDVAGLWSDLQKRPYITAGFAAWVLLIPLAVTSTDGMVRRLGRRWKMLHRGIYLVALLALLHMTWLAKASYAEPVAYSAIVMALFFYRFTRRRTRLLRAESSGAE